MIEIGGLQKLTLIDFPGKISCTVFCLGCNFRCGFCYNSELVLPEKIKKVSKILEKDFFEFLKGRKEFLEGVVLGGGEPTSYPELTDFCKKIKKMGYFIKLDTNGSNPEMIKELINQKLVDYIAMDVKAPKEKYLKVIGWENNIGSKVRRLNFWQEKIIGNVEKSIEILKEGRVDSEFRTTVVPGLIFKGDILKIVKWVSPSKKYFLQNFRPEKTVNPKFEKIKPYPQEYLLGIQKAIAPFFEVCQVR